jgi:hypothetical protein
MRDQLLRPVDVANLHPGLTVELLKKHRHEGTGPAWFRRGKRAVAYLASEVDRWITESSRSVPHAPALSGDKPSPGPGRSDAATDAPLRAGQGTDPKQQ